MKKIQNTALLVCTISLLGATVGAGSVTAADQRSGVQNRLAHENSPYLLLHAHNPVDWYPWGPEALEKARAEDKPIFLSVGYSSCYWCHVMERKVFSNKEIAKFLNEKFICIKVDREERPDVDDIYMTSLLVYQQLSGGRGRGGWPLSLFLTPAGNPIAGATYLPPEDLPGGRRGFLTIARRIFSAWSERRGDVERSSQLISKEVRRLSVPAAAQASDIDSSVVQTAVSAVESLYDSEWGGVDLTEGNQQGPRFPNIPRLLLLMSVIEESKSPANTVAKPLDQLQKMVHHSFTRMAQGGIRDHLAGGFHRYSTDRRWRVPHFEKMLYDQAQLLEGYTIASQLTGEPLFEEVAVEIADFVRKEFTTPQGAFCSALDAETNAIEGEYYVWHESEIDQLLSSDDAKLFKSAYGVGNSNPFEHGHILHLPKTVAELSRNQNTPVSQFLSRLAASRQTLLDARNKRERPFLDDKVLTAWNAMMIRALAISGLHLNRATDIAAAKRAARFLLKNLRNEDGDLLRSWRSGEATHAAYLDDYAFLVSALIALHDATGDDEWMQLAQELNERQLSRFYDDEQHVFYFTAHDHEQLIARTSSPFDSVFPSGNSVAIRNLIRLSGQSDDLSETARQTLLRFLPVIQKSPASSSGLALAVHEWLVASEKYSSSTSTTLDGKRSSGSTPDQESQSSPESPAADEETAIKTRTVFRPVLTPDPVQKNNAKKRVTAHVFPRYNKLPRGKKCPVAIELRVQEGWHINANRPHSNFLIPTEINLKTKPKVNVRMTRIAYPKHKLHTIQQESEPYHVYDGKVMIYCLLETDAQESTNVAKLEFHIRYQACNDDQCEKPVTMVMKGVLPLADPHDDIEKLYPEKFKKAVREKSPAPKATNQRRDSDEQS